MHGAGITFDDLIAWNAYPCYINSKPSAAQLKWALPVLDRLVGMCPQLEVVMVHGDDAQRGWRMYRKRYPESARRLHVVETYHTSNQVFSRVTPDVRRAREDKLRADFAEVAAILYPDRAPQPSERSDAPSPADRRPRPKKASPAPVDELHATARRLLQEGRTVEQIGGGTNFPLWHAAFVEEARLAGELIDGEPTPDDAVRLRDERKLRWQAVAARLFGDARKTRQAQALYDQAKGPGAAKRSWTGRGRIYPDMES